MKAKKRLEKIKARAYKRILAKKPKRRLVEEDGSIAPVAVPPTVASGYVIERRRAPESWHMNDQRQSPRRERSVS